MSLEKELHNVLIIRYYDDQIKINVRKIYSTHGVGEKCIQNCSQKTWREESKLWCRPKWEDNIKMNHSKWDVRVWVGFNWLRRVNSYEYDSGFTCVIPLPANLLSVLLLLLTRKQMMWLGIVGINNEAHKYLICGEFKKRTVR